MNSLLTKKYVFAIMVALLFVVCLILMERSITSIGEVFQQGTITSLSIYALGAAVSIEFFRRLFVKKNFEQGFVYGLAVFLGLPLGFLLALCLQMVAIRFFQ
jgi:hypothetical protein